MTQPKWLTKPDDLEGRALKIWKELAPSAFKFGYLKNNNHENFRALCRCVALADAAGNEIEKNGVTIGAKTGIRRANPAIKIMFDAQREVKKLLREFGLTD